MVRILPVEYVYGSIRWYTVVYGGIRWYTVVYGGIRWYTVVYGGIRRIPGLESFGLEQWKHPE